MSLTEFEERPSRKQERYRQMRSIMDIAMGIIYTAVGLVVIFSEQLQINNENLMSTPVKIFGGVAVIYGVWRIYRGIKKNYFKR